MKKNIFKKTLSFILSVIILGSVMNFNLYAAPNQDKSIMPTGVDFTDAIMPEANPDYNGFIADPTQDVIPVGAIPISTPEQLAAIGGEQSAGKYYVLANDINLINEWVPINDFRGTLDGQGYSINGLTVTDGRQYAGLFGLIDTQSNAVNIMNVTVNIAIGGINTSGKYSCAGGIVGCFDNSGSITDCRVNGSVSAAGEPCYAGGIAGWYGGVSVTGCMAAGSVNAAAWVTAGGFAGGIIGYVSGSININNSYTAAAVSASVSRGSILWINAVINSQSCAGGLIGRIDNGPDSVISDCYTTGNSSGSTIIGGNTGSRASTYAGGLIGFVTAGSISVANCYATGNVSGNAACWIQNSYRANETIRVGGIYGSNDSSSSISINNCYRLSTQVLTSGSATPNTIGSPLTPAEMRTHSSFSGWDFNNIWAVNPEVNDGYPILRAFYSDAPVSGVTLNKTSATIVEGASEKLTAAVEPRNALNKAVTWKSSNTKVAVVDGTGVVTAVSPGTATVTARTVDGDFTANCTVTVTPVIRVTGVRLNKTATEILTDIGDQLTATVSPANATNKAVTWSSSNTKVAVVDGTGAVTAVFLGTATITAKTADGGFTASCVVTVKPSLNAILIKTEADLRAISGANSTGKYYILANDIYLTSEWSPINGFRGTFDGQQHTINNLYVLAKSRNKDAGLFGIISNGAVIKNLGINIGEQGVAASSTNDDTTHAGGLVGHCAADGSIIIIENCRVTGGGVTAASAPYAGIAATPGMAYAGGLAGRCYGENFTINIENCYSTVEVSAESESQAFAGGLVGTFYSENNAEITVKNCYATGGVSADRALELSVAGGFIGLLIGVENINQTMSIENCYAAGNVSSTPATENSYAGGFVGYNFNTGFAKITGCYRLAAQTISGSEIDDSGTALTGVQIKNKASFTGWDFVNVWDCRDGINGGYPVLRIFDSTEKLIASGDLDGDGEITISDLVLLARHIADIDPITNTSHLKAADVNGDGKINIADLIRLSQLLTK